MVDPQVTMGFSTKTGHPWRLECWLGCSIWKSDPDFLNLTSSFVDSWTWIWLKTQEKSVSHFDVTNLKWYFSTEKIVVPGVWVHWIHWSPCFGASRNSSGTSVRLAAPGFSTWPSRPRSRNLRFLCKAQDLIGAEKFRESDGWWVKSDVWWEF